MKNQDAFGERWPGSTVGPGIMQSRTVDRGDSPAVRDLKESLGDTFGSGDLQMSLVSDRKILSCEI